MKKWTRRLGLILVALTSLAFAGVSAEEGATLQRQEKALHKVTTPLIVADGREAATPALPGCRFLGVWRGGYFSAGEASLWLDEHDGWRDWVAEYTGPPDFDGEIVLVQRATLNTTSIPFGGDSHDRMSHLRTPLESDLASGFDVYLCKRARPAPPAAPMVIVQSLNPLTIQLVPQAGTAVTGNLLLVSPPGLSEFGSFTVPVSLDTPVSAPHVVNTGIAVPVVPLVELNLDGGTSPAPAQHLIIPRAVSPVANDRTAFVFEVTPNVTLWRPIFRLTVNGAGPFDFPGPRIFNAFDSQIITLNLPNNVAAPGAGIDDVQLTIPSSSPLDQAPPEARVLNQGPIFSLTDRALGHGQFQTTLYNPLDVPVNLSNDSVGLVLSSCSTNKPLGSIRSNLNLTIPARGHTLIDYDFATNVDLGGSDDVPPPPDPSSPTFTDDLLDWFADICFSTESHPALTPP